MIKTVQLGFAAAQNYGKKHFTTAVKTMKELSGKTVSKAKGIGTKISAQRAQLAKDTGAYKGSFLKDFASEVRREGRGLRKIVTFKNIGSTAWNYPITTGFVAGASIKASLPKKDKKKKRA